MKLERIGMPWGLFTKDEKSEFPATPNKTIEMYSCDLNWVSCVDQDKYININSYRIRQRPTIQLDNEWIESNGGWPDGMYFAAVDCTGDAFFYKSEPSRMSEGWGVAECLRICNTTFDYTYWSNYLVVRPRPKPVKKYRPRPKPVKKYRPWTPEEAVGKVVRDRYTGAFQLITTATVGCTFCIGSGRHGIGWEQLYQVYTQSSGSPCGVEVEVEND